MSQLSEALGRANREDMPLREIERRAEKLGKPLTISTISRYMRGQHPSQPNLDVIRAFAAVFGTDTSHILEDAKLPAVGSRFELPAKADLLDDSERQAILHLIDVMAAKKKG
ncbi:helix-turn-helix domain-containing protein [Rothia sp. AR01]|uniref:Helix-turn-helix domain-containing protein n=1 Tax=Rothia santali TaxID=2949643 RepID=A0A9X2HAF2_9MICC|nr:helix-turn-helix domain-containing protein [Rothia santali]MCP3425999.1 helix-turn-helix domain-containing protein [Rothia santali]